MRKLYVSLCLALVVGTLTLTNGILHDVRMTTIIYRVAISIILFGILGYVIGVVGEKIYRELVAKDLAKNQHNHIVSEEQSNDEVVPESEFSPFASDNFEQISRPKE